MFMVWMFSFIFVSLISLFLLILTQTHPFFVSLSLVVVSMNVVGLMMSFSEHWLNFVFVLVYLGGILVIFVYTSSTLPNIFYSQENPKIWFLIVGAFFFTIHKNFFLLFEKAPTIFSSMLNFEWLPLCFFFGFLMVVLVVSIEFAWQKMGPMKSI